MSRKLLPKQFLPLVSERSMLQDTALRAAAVAGAQAPIVVSNDDHRFLVAEQMRSAGIKPARLILEPVGRNTAPAIAAAALAAIQIDANAVLCVLPSDHLIREHDAFAEAIGHGVAMAAEGLLVTFGIVPSEPATGYGYIERGDPVTDLPRAFRVKQFVEKPALQRAQEFLASGRFFWNSGMFVFPAQGFLDELEQLRPDILGAVRQASQKATEDLDFVRLEAAAFGACPSDSVDYAVMEKTSKAAVLATEFGWSDVGSWSSLWDTAERDAQGNFARGDVYLDDASDCYVRAEHRLVAVLGAKDLIVVETDDAVLVADRSQAQQVKQIVERLQAEGRSEHHAHSRVYRPWGYYESIDHGSRFQVKRIMVKPGAALSLQMHHHRAEHWVVVSGTAKVTHGEEVSLLSENQSTYIPIGTRHRLENPGKLPLFLIEVQSGGYLGEDDIVRFEDVYKRA